MRRHSYFLFVAFCIVGCGGGGGGGASVYTPLPGPLMGIYRGQLSAPIGMTAQGTGEVQAPASGQSAAEVSVNFPAYYLDFKGEIAADGTFTGKVTNSQNPTGPTDPASGTIALNAATTAIDVSLTDSATSTTYQLVLSRTPTQL